MAFVSYVDIDPAQESTFFKIATAQDRFSYSRIRKKTSFFSRHKRFLLLNKSLLPQIATLWAGLSTAEKNAWTTAGAFNYLNGWRTFVAEMSIRIKLGLSTSYTPSNFHQGWFGHLTIASPANEIKIAQYHPAYYYVRHKVAGIKGLYEPVKVNEPITLPITIGLSYYSDLVASLPNPYAKFYIIVRSSYQGIDRENVCEIDIDAVSDWKAVTATITQVYGYVIGYTAYIHIYGYRGDFYFDNVKLYHSSVNWARDFKCSDINASFSNTYYQIPKNWVELELPSGALYDSDYIDF